MNRIAIAAVMLAVLAFGGSAQAVTPKQTIAKLRTQLAAQKRATATARTEAAQGKAAIAALQAQIATGTAALATANSGLATANTRIAEAQGTIGSLQASLGGSVAGQVAVMTSSQLWALLGSANARFVALADTKYTTSYFAGTTFFSYDFDYFAS